MSMSKNYHQPLVEDAVYHIYNRSITGINLFTNAEEYDNFLLKFNKYVGFFFEIYAYCLIPNHYHFLVKVKSISEINFSNFGDLPASAFRQYISNEITLSELIEDQFRRLFSSMALSYNHRHKRRGPLFEGRFKRVSVKSELRILYLLCYIHPQASKTFFKNGSKSTQYSCHGF